MKKTKLFMTALLVGLMSVFAVQTAMADASAYDKKVQQIHEKYYSLIEYGVVKSLNYNDKMAAAMGMAELEFVNKYLKATEAQQKTLDRIWSNYQKELEDAKSLLTPAEKAAIKRRQLERSPYGKRILPVKNKIAKWATKGDYEKTVDYEKRLQTQVADSAMKWCKEIANIGMFIRIKKVDYNPDTEKATLQIQYKLSGNKEYADVYQIVVPMSVEYAKTFSTIDNDYRDFSHYPYDFSQEVYNEKKIYNINYVQKLKDEYYFYPASVSFTISGKEYTAKAPSNIKLKDYTIDLSDVENAGKYLKGYGYNYTINSPIIPQAVRTQVKAKVDELNPKIAELYEKINQALLAYPFNVDTITLAGTYRLDASKFSSPQAVIEQYNADTLEIISLANQKAVSFAKKIQKNDPSRFLSIAYETYPQIKEKSESMYRDYSCNYSEADFVLALVFNEELKGGDCKAKYYKQNKDLYTSQAEFNLIYAKGEEVFQQDLAERKQYAEIFKAYKDMFATPKLEWQGYTYYYYNYAVKANFQGLNEAPKQKSDVMKLKFWSLINTLRGTVYSNETITYLLKWNNKIAKEYPKVKQYFTDEWAFWDAYASANYKQILKDNKKKYK